MFSRRDLLQSVAALSTTSLLAGGFPEAIARAFAIEADPGTTFADAEHVVILMQENRSFDHAYGTLRGVRGFRDPRPFRLPSGDPVWFQPSGKDEAIPPFRISMENTNVTWMGGTPHSWRDQIDARANGKYDNWLKAKTRGDGYPLTMSFFTREDIPFYYALADAFTVCDYAFCSTLTGTTPNRLHLWTGTCRDSATHPPRVLNSECDFDSEASYKTFPERLEDAKVSWRIYQNEVSVETGLSREEDAWLSSFGCNPIEHFTQFGVRFRSTRRGYIESVIADTPAQISELERQLQQSSLADDDRKKLSTNLDQAKKKLAAATEGAKIYNSDTWRALTPRQRSLHARAFTINTGDPNYREVEEYEYDDNGTSRKVFVPKGDVLHQFRRDVERDQLPAVSWLVAPERFSDHPGSAWYGAWYLSEVLNILTEDPAVWKKTIFILCYDENDGFFDHVPPFVAPHPDRPETGKVSTGIDTGPEIGKAHGRDHSMGLGYRCPLVVASPWSRGGWVNSQVCDHTSVVMFVESWLRAKGTAIREENINDWRRTVCGDLTSTLRPYNGEKIDLPDYLSRNEYIERIHKARFAKKPEPAGKVKRSEFNVFQLVMFQEPGTRPSNALPYRIEADITPQQDGVQIRMSSKKEGVGTPFMAYSYGNEFLSRAYAVLPGDTITDTLPRGENTSLRIDGPNGFLREYNLKSGISNFSARVAAKGGFIELTLEATAGMTVEVKIADLSYGQGTRTRTLEPGQREIVRASHEPGKGWYDIEVSAGEESYRFAGRVEDGRPGISDPAME